MNDFEHSYYLANAEVKKLEAAIVTWKEEEVAWKETEAALLTDLKEANIHKHKLQERFEKAEEFGRGNQARAVKAEARVEELQDDLAALAGASRSQGRTNAALRVRVEELEKDD